MGQHHHNEQWRRPRIRQLDRAPGPVRACQMGHPQEPDRLLGRQRGRRHRDRRRGQLHRLLHDDVLPRGGDRHLQAQGDSGRLHIRRQYNEVLLRQHDSPRHRKQHAAGNKRARNDRAADHHGTDDGRTYNDRPHHNRANNNGSRNDRAGDRGTPGRHIILR